MVQYTPVPWSASERPAQGKNSRCSQLPSLLEGPPLRTSNKSVSSPHPDTQQDRRQRRGSTLMYSTSRSIPRIAAQDCGSCAEWQCWRPAHHLEMLTPESRLTILSIHSVQDARLFEHAGMVVDSILPCWPSPQAPTQFVHMAEEFAPAGEYGVPRGQAVQLEAPATLYVPGGHITVGFTVPG